MDYRDVNDASRSSLSSGTSGSPDIQTGLSRWRQNFRHFIHHARKSKCVQELALIATSLLAMIALTILLLYNVLFAWYPSSQYSIAGHNFISEHEAGQVDGLSRWTEDFSRTVIPIMCHSHNDYWRVHPLFSALAAGCTGVEADVWLSDDGKDLLVGHDKSELRPERTLRNMYIDPLLEILDRQNPAQEWANHTVYDRARGVFPSSPNQTLVLLIDVKEEPQKTWELVEQQLAPLSRRQYLTHVQAVFPAPGFVERQRIWPQPITVVATGNMDREALWVWSAAHREFHSDDPWEEDLTSQYRDFFVDAPLARVPDDNTFGEELDDDGNKIGTWANLLYYSEYFYYASTSFKQTIGDTRLGFSEKQLAVLRRQIWTAKKSGLRSRYWDLPSWPISHRDYVWDVLTREGADMLSVDDLESAARRGWSKGYVASVVWMIISSALVVASGGIMLAVIWKAVKLRHEAAARAPGEIHLP